MDPTVSQVAKRRRRRVAEVLSVLAVVLAWRLAAWLSPSSLVDLEGPLAVAMGMLGFFFVGCGVVARLARPNRFTAIFLLYGLGNGVHWGGPIGADSVQLETGLFFVYLFFTLFGDAALLHLSLQYPRHPQGRNRLRLLYAPSMLGLILVPAAWYATVRTLEALAGGLLLIANLMSLAGGVIFIGRLFTVDAHLRRTSGLPLVAAGMVIAAATALLGAGGLLPGTPEAWNLALLLIPAALAVALVSFDPGRGS